MRVSRTVAEDGTTEHRTDDLAMDGPGRLRLADASRRVGQRHRA